MNVYVLKYQPHPVYINYTHIYIKLSTNTADKIYLFKIRNSLLRHKNGSSGDYLKLKVKTKVNTIIKPGINANRIKTEN